MHLKEDTRRIKVVVNNNKIEQTFSFGYMDYNVGSNKYNDII